MAKKPSSQNSNNAKVMTSKTSPHNRVETIPNEHLTHIDEDQASSNPVGDEGVDGTRSLIPATNGRVHPMLDQFQGLQLLTDMWRQLDEQSKLANLQRGQAWFIEKLQHVSATQWHVSLRIYTKQFEAFHQAEERRVAGVAPEGEDPLVL